MSQAADVMTTTVVSVSPETTMKEAASLLLRHRVSGVPVVDDSGQIVGVISEFDLLKLVYSPEMEFDRVGDHMSTKLLTVTPDEPLIEIVDIFMSHPIRRLPVISEGKLVGLISRHDLIRFVLVARDRVSTAQRERLSAVTTSGGK